MTFSSRPPMSHVWYMEMILGLYLALPLIGLLQNVFGKRGMFVLFAASVFCHFIRPLFQIAWLDLSFLGDSYFVYVLFGCCVHLAKNRTEKMLAQKPVYVVLLLLFAMNLAFCVFRQNQTTPMRLMWYDNLSMIPAAMFPPLLLLPLGKWENPLATYIAIQAFAVYLLHNVVLTLCGQVFFSIPSRGWRIVCAWLVSMIIPLLVTLALSKCPRLKKWLFLISHDYPAPHSPSTPPP